MTLCPQCHLENREGRRFCSKCAAPLAVVCAARKGERGYRFTGDGTYARLIACATFGGGPKGLRSPVHSRSACRWPGGWS